MLASLRSVFARVGPWPRRVAALACLVLAGFSALDAHRRSGPAPTGAESVPIAVAARALPVGHLLARRDVTVRSWPRSLLPPGAFGLAARSSAPRGHEQQWLGHRLAAPLGRGEPVTSRRLVGRDLTTGLAGGQVAVAVAVADPHVLELVHAGDRVDVLATAREMSATARADTSVVAEAVVVLGAFGTSGVAGGSDTSDAPAEVVLATSRDTATRLAGVSSTDVVTIVGRSP